MKTLFVLRHAKSSWSDDSLADHDRPLKSRGKEAARKIGAAIRERDLMPDLVISSTATRALATARRALDEAGYGGAVVQDPEIYFTSVSKQIATIVRHSRPDHERILIVGHNPALEELISTLTGEEVALTTANLAAIELEIDAWGDLPKARGKLRFVIRPRELG